MLDFIGVAGLALAIFDEILTIGERTAEVISDIRHFDEVSKKLHEQVRHELWKMSALRRILFNQSRVYGGAALIQKLDDDAQDQIHVCLMELLNGFQAVLKLFETLSDAKNAPDRSLGASNTVSGASYVEKNLSTLSLGSTAPRRENTRSPFQLAWWSLRTKKKAIENVNLVTQLNSQLLEKVQLISLASEIGVNLQHLEHLQKNPDSIELGFNNDATLKLAVTSTDTLQRNFELDDDWDIVLRDSLPLENCFATFEWNGKHMLQENCMNVLGEGSGVDKQTRNRINSLASLLNEPKQELFCILPCQGWKYLPAKKGITYLFELPSDLYPQPKSLLKLVSEPSSQPSLGTKFRIVLSLARSLAQLHMVRWVHESVRSENIIFFPKSPIEQPLGADDPTVDYSKPWIFGFEFSRPDSFFSAGFIDVCPDRDVYRHPERQGQPLTTFKKIHDIYALGVIMLELGVWRPAVTLERNRFAHAKDPHAIKAHLIRHAQKHLHNSMGEKYRDITLLCLSGNFGILEDTRDDLRLQQAFRTQVVDVLRRMVDNI